MRYLLGGLALVLIVTTASVATADPLSRKEVERHLRTNFKSAQSFQLLGMKENYWGLYRTYHVTFNLRETASAYHVGCDLVDRRPSTLDLTSCEATDANGQKVSDSRARELGFGTSNDIAKLKLRDTNERMPANAR